MEGVCQIPSWKATNNKPMHAACCSESKHLHGSSSLSYLTSAKEHGPHSVTHAMQATLLYTQLHCMKLLDEWLSWQSDLIS